MILDKSFINMYCGDGILSRPVEIPFRRTIEMIFLDRVYSISFATNA